MTIQDSSYDTTIGTSMNLKTLEHAIKEAFIKDMISERKLNLISSLEYKPVFITGQFSSESNIPFFAHPLIIKNYKGENFICVDVRPFIKIDNNSGFNHINIKNQTEYNFALTRTILNMAWLNGDINQLKINLSFAGTVYAAWLSETISKRFALDPKDQMILSIITHFYYQTLFVKEEHIEEEMLQKFAVHTIKATKAPSQLVMEVFDKIKDMTTIQDYCNNVKDILQNIRLVDLNPGILITMIGATWFSNTKEILAVALEHPPTWLAIVHAALTERGYKNSLIARIAERYGKNNASSEFMLNFNEISLAYVDRNVANESLTFNKFD